LKRIEQDREPLTLKSILSRFDTHITGVPSHDVKTMYYASELGVWPRSELYAVGYLSSPETYPNYLSTAQQMIDSFQIVHTK